MKQITPETILVVVFAVLVITMAIIAMTNNPADIRPAVQAPQESPPATPPEEPALQEPVEVEVKVVNYGLTDAYLTTPAHEHCKEHGTLHRDDPEVCVLEDGTEIDIWQYFTGENEGLTTELSEREQEWLSKGWRFNRDGWAYVHLEGSPFEIGFQNGYLMAPEIVDELRLTRNDAYRSTGMHFSFFADKAVEMYNPKIGADWEYAIELHGIAYGVRKAGYPDVTYGDIMALNAYEELVGYWWPTVMEGQYEEMLPNHGHCSAFIATGDATADGRIVIAHNTWNNFNMGQVNNVTVDLVPEHGHRILMQSQPGFVHSIADFYITGSELMITETTIGGFEKYNVTQEPEFFRIRRAVQYSEDIDSFVSILNRMNDGGYANTWLIGDIETSEIAQYEEGLKFTNLTRTFNGHFAGFNAPQDARIRNLECSDSGIYDIRRHSGARRLRWMQVLSENYGNITVEMAKEFLADHYDVYLEEDNHPSSRTLSGHYELDDRAYMSDPSRPPPYMPRGTMDGKAADSTMGAVMSFWARAGSSDGMAFDASAFLEEHEQWSHLKDDLYDRPSNPWTVFQIGQTE